MKRLMLAFAVATAFALHLGAVTLTVDAVTQRYPWNGLVDIDYTITLGEGENAFTADDAIKVTVTDADQEPAKTYHPLIFLQNGLPVSAGKHRITWDANAEGVTFVSQHATATLEIVHYPAEYCIVTISEGPEATSYPVEYMNTVPEGGFNTAEYKGDKIVLRRIRPGCFYMGSPTTEKEHQANEVLHFVALSNSFYVGVFEVTQKQWLNVMGEDNPSEYQGDYRPVEKVTYWKIRGQYNSWPGNPKPYEASFLGQLSKRTGLSFDLPTEAQWEFACRAGPDTPFNDNYPGTTFEHYNASIKKLGRARGNQTDGKGDPAYDTAHTSVGGYQANAFGLYDMHGNVAELCRDTYVADLTTLGQIIEPAGPSASGSKTIRGGHWDCADQSCRSAWRASQLVGNTNKNVGFRLALLP